MKMLMSAISALVVWIGTTASAVTYNEVVDLPGTALGLPLGVLAPDTTYTFSGTINATCSESSEFAQEIPGFDPLYFSSCDAFTGDVADGLWFVSPTWGLASAEVTISGLDGSFNNGESGEVAGTGGLGSVIYGPGDDPCHYFGSCTSSSSTVNLLTDGSGLLQSTFVVSAFGYNIDGNSEPFTVVGDVVDFSWTLSVVTNPVTIEPEDPETPVVPLPAGLWLGMTGLGALVLSGARRRRDV